MGGGFTRPSVHQRSEALKEPCDGLGVFKRGTQWATIQDSVGSASETGSDHLHTIAEEVSRVAELCIGQDMGTMSTAAAKSYRIPPREGGVTDTPEQKYSDSGTSY